jgi:hypothetical protein
MSTWNISRVILLLGQGMKMHSIFIMSSQNRYYNEYHEGLLELAKGFLKILLNQLVDKTMVAAVKEK